MSGPFTGIFDPLRRLSGASLALDLGAQAPSAPQRGPLRLAPTGPAPKGRRTLVLLEGYLSNRGELAASLKASPEEDSEALLALAYARWGASLLGRLRGDFALLIWDEDHGEGLVARDPLGMRCIYLYDRCAPVLHFATEIHQLLAVLPTRPVPDPVSVAHWVAISPRPSRDTLYTGIRRLDPGSALILDRHGHRPHRYWSLVYSERAPRTAEQQAQELRAGLEGAVRERLPAEGRVSVLMSGGLDSATVAALAAREAPGRVLAHAGVFPGLEGVDESGLIALLRARLGLAGATASVAPGGLLASVLEHLHAWQLPLLGWGDFWTLPLLRGAAREGVRVTLGGDGGDELFGARGYLIADRLRAGRPASAWRLAARLPGAGNHPSRSEHARVLASLGLLGALPAGPHAQIERLPGRSPRWLTQAARRDVLCSDDPYAWKRLDGPRWWAHPAYGLTRGIEQSAILEHQRHRAALAGLQARLPMLDPALITLALRHPPQESFDAHLSRPLLRRAMAGLLPEEVRLRAQKAWFDSLIVACMTGEECPLIRALLTGPGAQTSAYATPAEVVRSLDALHTASGVERFRSMHLIWRLLSIECWLRLQADPDGSTLPTNEQTAPVRVRVSEVAAAPAAPVSCPP